MCRTPPVQTPMVGADGDGSRLRAGLKWCRRAQQCSRLRMVIKTHTQVGAVKCTQVGAVNRALPTVPTVTV